MIFFRRKPKNRRLGNTHVLDVKLRSDQVHASRMRLTAVILGVTFGTVLGFYLIWRAGEFTLNRLVYDNSAFAIEQIDVETDGVISKDQLRRWAGVKLGENLLALDLSRVKRDLELVPVIRTVAVERILPGTLHLRVSEREPLAKVQVYQPRPRGGVETNTLHLDDEGYVMTLVEPSQRAVPLSVTNDYLPVVTGINQTDLLPGRKVDSPQASAALQLIDAFDNSPMSGLVDIATIDISSPQVLEVKTVQGSEIFFAIGDYDTQLRHWRAIYDEAQHFGKAIATFDLSVPHNSPLTLVKATAVPPASPKNKKSQHNRNKHNV